MQKRARVSREMTFQDIYGAETLLNDDDEEDDSDWEPVQTPLEFVKWSCVNCTMANPGDMVHCFVRFLSTFFFLLDYYFFVISSAICMCIGYASVKLIPGCRYVVSTRNLAS